MYTTEHVYVLLHLYTLICNMLTLERTKQMNWCFRMEFEAGIKGKERFRSKSIVMAEVILKLFRPRPTNIV